MAALVCSAVLSAQETAYEFQQLKVADTITNAEYQQLFGSKDVKSKFLISKWKIRGQSDQLALFKKMGVNWLVFPLFEQQTTENVKLTEDEKYMTYVTSAINSGNGFSQSRFYFCIVDLDNEKQLPIVQQSNDETWDVAEAQKADAVKQTGCSAQIVFLGKGNLTSMYTATKDFEPDPSLGDCLPKGQYKIKDGKLVRIK